MQQRNRHETIDKTYFSNELCLFFFSSRRRHTRSLCDWSSDVCSSDLSPEMFVDRDPVPGRVQGLFGKMDRSRADVLVSVKADLLEHAREACDLYLAVIACEAVSLRSGEGVQDLHRHRCEGVR